jgi:hypothetical protein
MILTWHSVICRGAVQGWPCCAGPVALALLGESRDLVSSKSNSATHTALAHHVPAALSVMWGNEGTALEVVHQAPKYVFLPLYLW